jgi:chemotaxis protein methyltransferase CheR
MPLISQPFSWSDHSFILLRDLIHERIGIYYDTNHLDLLADKLSERLISCALESFLDYYYLLKYDESAQQEWKQVMDLLSVPETFFWREMDQVRAVVDILVPQYFSGSRVHPLRIWSAACATGEEPLTIAIALQEAGWLDRVEIEIYASDGSGRSIEVAKQGLYRSRSFRNLPPALQLKYFHKEGDCWRIQPELHRQIHWKTANLMVESEIKQLAKADIIFCRNVFIYFSESSIKKTLNLFAGLMPNPGYLCVAASESLLKLTNIFKLQEIGGAFIYVKQENLEN